MSIPFSPYSTVKPFFLDVSQPWFPPLVRDRIQAYCKYDEIYWNDESQFRLRILNGENPIYIPNARTIVDTTSYYLLKGLQITVDDPVKLPELAAAIKALSDRELFYPRFHTAKHAGVARGDYAFHLTANPNKAAGKRISFNSVDPGCVVPIFDDDDMTKLVRLHIIDVYRQPSDGTANSGEQVIKKLTYEYGKGPDSQRVFRSEGVYKLNEKWWGTQPDLIKITIPYGPLPPQITTIPVYWFKNMDWEGQEFGSSELRGFERLLQGISQAGSDQSAALALEGLGVYATDGGRPVNDNGQEEDWEISPGRVMEVPTGSYFRRVEGLTSMKPSMDHIDYIEGKLREASGLSDVALGRVDVQTAQSGIALAIKFIPTLAKIEERDTAGLASLKQLWYDWQNGWMPAYEGTALEGEIIPVIGDKLPEDRTATINELNNMLDRGVIPKSYYRTELQKLGYIFPDDIQDQIDKETEAEIKLKTPPALQAGLQNPNELPSEPGKGSSSTLPPAASTSNNSKKPNESSGTESGQSLRRQSRGGKP